eukprot:1955255-Pyramimonas_sp.AAC.1
MAPRSHSRTMARSSPPAPPKRRPRGCWASRGRSCHALDQTDECFNLHNTLAPRALCLRCMRIVLL